MGPKHSPFPSLLHIPPSQDNHPNPNPPIRIGSPFMYLIWPKNKNQISIPSVFKLYLAYLFCVPILLQFASRHFWPHCSLPPLPSPPPILIIFLIILLLFHLISSTFFLFEEKSSDRREREVGGDHPRRKSGWSQLARPDPNPRLAPPTRPSHPPASTIRSLPFSFLFLILLALLHSLSFSS